MAAIAVSSSEADGRDHDAAPRVSHDLGTTVVWLNGEQDISTTQVLQETLAQAIAFDDADLIVDLSGVTFVGAATISVLMRGRDFLRQRSRRLTLRSPSRCAQRLLDACGLLGLVNPGSSGAAATAGSPD